MPEIDLVGLCGGTPALDVSACAAMAKSAAVCLREQGHKSGVILAADGDLRFRGPVRFPRVTAEMRRTYADPQEATEHGACAIALLVVRHCAKLEIIERSYKGTGFDYWLGPRTRAPFQRKSRLEVSGIRCGSDVEIDRRLRRKTEQTRRSDGQLPAYVIVVEFSRPVARVKYRGFRDT